MIPQIKSVTFKPVSSQDADARMDRLVRLLIEDEAAESGDSQNLYNQAK